MEGFVLLKEHLSRGLQGELLLTCVAAFYFELWTAIGLVS